MGDARQPGARPRASRESLERGATLLSGLSCVYEEAQTRASLGTAYLASGMLAAARREFERVSEVAGVQESGELAISSAAGQAAIARMEGAVDEARIVVLRGLTDATIRIDLWAVGRMEIAAGELSRGEVGRARELLAEILARVTPERHLSRGRVLLLAARAAREASDLDEAARCLGEARDLLSRLPYRVDLARCAVEGGLLALARGGTADAAIASAEALAADVEVLAASELAVELRRLKRSASCDDASAPPAGRA